MRIVMFGSREWDKVHIIHKEIDRLLNNHGDNLVIIHGDARGADSIVRHYAEKCGITHECYCAAKRQWKPGKSETMHHVSDWNKDGKVAGLLRNQAMIDQGKPVGAVAFDLGTRGTADMTGRCKQAGLPILEYRDDGNDIHVVVNDMVIYKGK